MFLYPVYLYTYIPKSSDICRGNSRATTRADKCIEMQLSNARVRTCARVIVCAYE